jgi:hypothetical protein
MSVVVPRSTYPMSAGMPVTPFPAIPTSTTASCEVVLPRGFEGSGRYIFWTPLTVTTPKAPVPPPTCCWAGGAFFGPPPHPQENVNVNARAVLVTETKAALESRLVVVRRVCPAAPLMIPPWKTLSSTLGRDDRTTVR